MVPQTEKVYMIDIILITDNNKFFHHESTDIVFMILCRVPSVLENPGIPGEKWKLSNLLKFSILIFC